MHYFVLLLFVSITSFAQTNYEGGYFIDQHDKRTECLIKNEDWLRTPSSIKYKIGSTSEPTTIDISELREFSVSNAKYICATVKMDTSSQDTRSLTTSRSPAWAIKHVALKTLVEGNAKLYYYDNGKLLLFFFSVNNSPIEQLEYKQYNIIDKNDHNTLKAAQNLNYINQLQTLVSCGDEPKVAIHKMKYNKEYLVNYFMRFNNCSGIESTSYLSDKKERRKTFHLRLTPGVDFSTSKVQSVLSTNDKEYPDGETSFRIGAEAEFILPFNNNKWVTWIEPTYQSYTSTSPMPIEYSSIEVPVGIRHHFFLNQNLRLFLDAAAVFDFPIEYTAQWSSRITVDSFSPTASFAAGLGMEYKKFSIAGRYYARRSGTDDSKAFGIDFFKTSVILGYRIF